MDPEINDLFKMFYEATDELRCYMLALRQIVIEKGMATPEEIEDLVLRFAAASSDPQRQISDLIRLWDLKTSESDATPPGSPESSSDDPPDDNPQT